MPCKSSIVITWLKYPCRRNCHLQTWPWGERQPFCDESGVGFGACLAENSTPFWSNHLIRRSDEIWLPEWSGKLGGVERCAVRSRGVSWGKAFDLIRNQPILE